MAVDAATRNFETNMRYYRLKHGWSRRELATRAGVSHTTITEVELGLRVARGISLSSAVRVAATLKISLGEMIEALPVRISEDELEDMEFDVRSAINRRKAQLPRPRRRQ